MNRATRIVVGVDREGTYVPAIGLIERLRFPKPQLSLVHVAPERLPVMPAFGDSLELEERFAQVSTNLGCDALHEATARAAGKDLACEGRLVHGSPASRLVEEATEADLIAVNTRLQGVNDRSFLGSVGRALAIASPTSVLISKGEQGRRGVFRAVFATDGSPFSERCLQRLIDLRPAGLQEVHVVSAWEIGDREAALLGQNLAMFGGDADRIVEERVQATACDAASRLEEAGYRATTIVRRGRSNEVIHHAMAEVRADLLIVGSEGHGAMTRPLVGSVALHQTTVERYPVLIVRPQEIP